MSGYRAALEAAGAKVLAFEEFGDYQGTWIAITDRGVFSGSYGSCSGCDAFEAEFGYEGNSEEYHRKLAAFGQSYLDDPVDIDKLLADAMIANSWDDNLRLVLWLKEQRDLLQQ
jgi:hypothetical protein